MVGESGGERTFYPLIIAVTHNNSCLVKLLLKHGANKEIKNENGESPLTIAQNSKFEDIVNLLK